MKKINHVFYIAIFAINATYGQGDCVENPRENILFVGVPNTLVYIHPNHPCDSIIAISQQAHITGTPCNMTVWVTNTKTAHIKFALVKEHDTIIISEKVFRVRDIPAPKLSLAGKTKGFLSKKEITVQLGVSLYTEVQIQNEYKIKKILSLIVRGEKIVLSKSFNTNRFDRKSMLFFNKLKSGDRLILICLDATDQAGSHIFVESSEFLIR